MNAQPRFGRYLVFRLAAPTAPRPTRSLTSGDPAAIASGYQGYKFVAAHKASPTVAGSRSPSVPHHSLRSFIWRTPFETETLIHGETWLLGRPSRSAHQRSFVKRVSTRYPGPPLAM